MVEPSLGQTGARALLQETAKRGLGVGNNLPNFCNNSLLSCKPSPALIYTVSSPSLIVGILLVLNDKQSPLQF